MFPDRRPRRLRRTPAIRSLVAETRLSPADFIEPIFVREGIDDPVAIASMPGIDQHTVDSAVRRCVDAAALGIPAVILFGVPSVKDPVGSGASDPDGIVQVAVRSIRDRLGDDLVVIADLCLDEYTDHGHCGLLDASGAVLNDETVERYCDVALVQAAAGVDIVAPSGMMDGQVGAIRAALDRSGHTDTAILAYAAKYASALYGPFRDAVDVEIAGGGDRRAYQQDVANVRESMMEIGEDLAQGADIVMVKPAGTYLDVIAAARRQFDVPLAAYQVSGEYAMVQAAASGGMIDGPAVALEQLVAIKRSGADLILTYFASDAARWLS